MSRPVFIVGCPRSGTTLLRQLLRAHPNLSCGPETHFLENMASLEEKRWKELARFGLSKSEWHMRVRDLFTWVHEHYAEEHGKIRWIDKTPGYALILDYIDQLYPDCQVIHVVRNPRDVIDSWRRRWGLSQAWAATWKWPQHVRAARAFRESHSEDRYIEVRYEDLVKDPREVVQKLISWLDEPWDEAVLAPRPRQVNKGRQEKVRQWNEDPSLEHGGDLLLPKGKESKPRTGSTHAAKQTPFSSSVGVGSRGSNRLVNAPFYLWLDFRAGDLVREMGYAKTQ